MSVGMFFILIIIAVALVLGVVAMVGYFSDPSRDNRAEVREVKQKLVLSRERERVATKALREIANGAGAPVLEASDALDRIEALETKELNS